MPKLPLTVRPKGAKTFLVEINADRLERLAASLGLVSKAFLKSLDQAEENIRAGRVTKLRTLADL